MQNVVYMYMFTYTFSVFASEKTRFQCSVNIKLSYKNVCFSVFLVISNRQIHCKSFLV